MTLQNFERYEDLAQNHLKRVKTKKDIKNCQESTKKCYKTILDIYAITDRKVFEPLFYSKCHIFPKNS